MTLEERVLDELDEREGLESFSVFMCVAGASLRSVRGALRRLARKGRAEAVRCPDGAWVWFRL